MHVVRLEMHPVYPCCRSISGHIAHVTGSLPGAMASQIFELDSKL